MERRASKTDNFPQIIIYGIFAWFLRSLLGIKVEGRQNIPSAGPVIIIANHRSKLDPFIILSAIKWRNFIKFYPWRFPLAKSLAEKWWLKWPSWFVGCYKITGKGELAKSLEDTYRAIDAGYSAIFFPEGKMILKDELSKPKRGIGHLCINRDLQILPVKICHSGFTKKSNRGKVNRSSVIFGKAIESRLYRRKFDHDNLHEVIMKRINEIDAPLEPECDCGSYSENHLGSKIQN